MTVRLSKSSLTGTARTLVAVGTVRLVSMFWTVRAAAPRIVTFSTVPGSPAFFSGCGGSESASFLAVSESGFTGSLFFAAGAAVSFFGSGSPSARSFLGAGSGSAFFWTGSAFAAGSAFFVRRRLGLLLGLVRASVVGRDVAVLEERHPGCVDRGGVVLVAVVHLLDEPLVGAEVGG